MNDQILTIAELEAARETLDYYTCPCCFPEECSCFPDEVDHE